MQKKNGLFLNEVFSSHGGRPFRNSVVGKKFIVVDDTCNSGRSLLLAKKKLCEKCFSEFQFVYCVVYMEGNGQLCKPDIWLRDVRGLANMCATGNVFYEWNLFAHPDFEQRCIFDLDGVFCVDPPDEINEKEYVEYIKNPTPLFVPTYTGSLTILTYRLNKYREYTENFLKSIGISRFELYMVDAETYEERSKCPPHVLKGNVYKNSTGFLLFVESDDEQARQINKISGKPVYCVETNKVYN